MSQPVRREFLAGFNQPEVEAVASNGARRPSRRPRLSQTPHADGGRSMRGTQILAQNTLIRVLARHSAFFPVAPTIGRYAFDQTSRSTGHD